MARDRARHEPGHVLCRVRRHGRRGEQRGPRTDRRRAARRLAAADGPCHGHSRPGSRVRRPRPHRAADRRRSVHSSAGLARPILFGGILLAALAVIVVVAARVVSKAHARVERHRSTVRRFARDLLDELAEPLGAARVVSVVALAVLAWLAWCVAAWCIARSVGIELSVTELALVASVINLGGRSRRRLFASAPNSGSVSSAWALSGSDRSRRSRFRSFCTPPGMCPRRSPEAPFYGAPFDAVRSTRPRRSGSRRSRVGRRGELPPCGS